MELKVALSIESIGREQWNAVAGEANPFLRYEFLAALERHGCVGAQHGWTPRHLIALDRNARLIGAVPLYLKDNSYGEFVFDWAWADAYQRQGLQYYPKSVVGIPYTPATGPRILVHPEVDRLPVAAALSQLALDWSRSENLSSLHWLFTDESDTRLLSDQGLLLRLGCQFHWRNQGYRDFDDYLSGFNSRKRKKVRRERRFVHDQNIEIRVIHGHEADDFQLRTMHDFYRTTFEKKWGYPTLTEAFFRDIAANMGEQLVFFIAYKNLSIVAGAICLRSENTLYGRHWGCFEDYNSLHFEACYYQGIDYCIRHGLHSFEPGAQGEHKVSRGFLPTPTWSAHWIAHEGFRGVIGRHLQQETLAMRDYMEELAGHSPFKDGGEDV
ncbi:MAG: GNAT family N-acetyltransferase [Thiogranum sp.]|nr:GNAT family N-acetyltransferase [Thiogranum sp.]